METTRTSPSRNLNTQIVTKAKALSLFDNPSDLARAIGIRPQAIYKWPDRLPARISDRVIAALVRTGRQIPGDFL